MSTNNRSPAVRVFAEEFNQANYVYQDGDDNMSPKYQLLPSGGRAGRILMVGTLTETEDHGDENEYWRGRVADVTGGINVYADDRYQPQAARVLRKAEPPQYVAIIGKPRTYTVEDDEGEETVMTKINPETVSILDEFNDPDVAQSLRNEWVMETARHTLDRIEGDSYQEMVEDHYGDGEEFDTGVLVDTVVNALETLEEDM